MPKPILKPQTQTESVLSLTKKSNQEMTQADKMKLDRLLRKPRSKAYLDAIKRLDAGGHTCNAQAMKEIVDAIRQEFPEVELQGVLLGVVSECFLGAPYEVHTININELFEGVFDGPPGVGGTTGVGYRIIEHYKTGQPLPGGMEKARGLAMQGCYDCIEVYVECCRAIAPDGSVSVIK